MAKVDKITPKKGKVGHTAVLHGDGLGGGQIEVKFGRAQGGNPHNPGGSTQNIVVTVLTKDALDSGSTVNVTVKIGGTAVGIPPAGISFDYNVPLPEPVITGVFASHDSATARLTATLTGTDFVTAQRQPDSDNAYLLGQAS